MISEIDERFNSLDEVSEHTNLLLIQLMDHVGVPDPARENKTPVPKSDN
jgi:hypothetical protein